MSTDLENFALSTYKSNLHYFENNQTRIFNKLAAYESAIEQNLYQSKYDLIIQENYFEVQELGTGALLYNADSTLYAELASQSLDFNKQNNAFATFKQIKIQKENLEKYAALSISENNLSGLAPILYYCDKNIPLTANMKSIKKFIFFGTGLGTHLASIDKKINAAVYLIVEDDLELFRLSLFTTPYFELAKTSNLIFSVFDTKEEFATPALEFLATDFYYNHYIKYFQMLNQSEEKLKEFHIKVASQSHNLFYYDAILKQYLKPLDYLQDGFKFLNILKTQNNPILTSKPLLLLGAGPSLQKNIPWIRANQDRFMIVALSATLSILEKELISPDMVTHIDGLEESITHFTKLKSIKFFKDTAFLISARTPREIVDLLNKNNIFFFETGTSYKIDFGNLSAACVGSATYLLMIALGFKNLYLLGLDLALDSQTGLTHSQGHEYVQKLELDSDNLNKDTITFKDTIIKVDGNFSDQVYTTPDFISSINSINSTSQGFKNDSQTVYNLSDGAYLRNTKSLLSSNIDITKLAVMNKEQIKHEINTLFSCNSETSISSDEFKALKMKYAYALSIEEVIHNQKSSIHNTHGEFLDSLILLYQQLASSVSSIEYDLSLVYNEYFRFIYTFIFDFYNSDGLKQDVKYATDINELLCTQLLRIVNVYKTELYNTIQEK